jgi:hypothetical protein
MDEGLSARRQKCPGQPLPDQFDVKIHWAATAQRIWAEKSLGSRCPMNLSEKSVGQRLPRGFGREIREWGGKFIGQPLPNEFWSPHGADAFCARRIAPTRKF